MLAIKNLHAKIDTKEILKGIDLTVNAGEIHAIMGPNGAGKSTLANVLAGRDHFVVSKGQILFNGQDIADMAPEKRAQAGLFLAFQYPVEIPGVSNIYLLKAALNSLRKARGEPELDAMDFLSLVKEKLPLIDLDQDLLYRSVNAGFSGGEKKRNEMLQLAVLEPQLAILDETDSGLDIDALKIVANGVNTLRNKNRAFILVTHYQRLLNYVIPDFVHVLYNGRIVKSGDYRLAQELEANGYASIVDSNSSLAENG